MFIYINVCIYTHICVFVCMCVYIYIYTYIYIYIYICVYIYIYKLFASKQTYLCNDQEPPLVGHFLTVQQKNVSVLDLISPIENCHENIPLNTCLFLPPR